MKTIVVTIICMGCILISCAQSYSRNHQTLFSAIQNQAGLSWLKKSCVGVRTERRFLMEALSLHRAAIAFPTGFGAIGGVVQQEGLKEYKTQLIGLAYSHMIGAKCSAGVQFNYRNRMIAGYGQEGSVSAEAGGLLQVTPQLIAGIHMVNPGAAAAGVGYEVSDNFLLSTALTQEKGEPPALQVMCEYALMPQCIMEMSWGSDVMQRSMAVAFVLHKLQVKVFAAHHPQLGFSPGTMIVYEV